jgi:hypothetical protein
VPAVLGSSLAVAQTSRITNTSNTTLAATIASGSLIPAQSSLISGGSVQFRIRNSNNNGNRVDATTTYSATTTAPVSGGATIAAGDIGVGITSVVPANGVNTNRSDVILPGFNYDPTAVVVTNGLTPYVGASGGQATIADLLTSKEILHGDKIAGNVNAGGNSNYLTVTLKAGILPQYFTPCSFSAVITLTISTGP